MGSGLRPTVEALPDLVRETHGLVVDVRALVRDLSPLLVDLTRQMTTRSSPG